MLKLYKVLCTRATVFALTCVHTRNLTEIPFSSSSVPDISSSPMPVSVCVVLVVHQLSAIVFLKWPRSFFPFGVCSPEIATSYTVLVSMNKFFFTSALPTLCAGIRGSYCWARHFGRRIVQGQHSNYATPKG